MKCFNLVPAVLLAQASSVLLLHDARAQTNDGKPNGSGTTAGQVATPVVTTAPAGGAFREQAASDDGGWKESFFTPPKKPPARMAVGLNPVGLLVGMFVGEFDYGLDESTSVNFNAQYWSILDTTAWGLGVGAQYFMHEVASSGPLYQGFYVYPSIQVSSVRVSLDFLGIEESSSYLAFAPQAVAGWQIDWRPFTMRLGAGFAYYVGSPEDGFRSDLSGLRFITDGTIGITFDD